MIKNIIDAEALTPAQQANVLAAGLDRVLTNIYKLYEKHPLALSEIRPTMKDAKSFLEGLEEEMETRERHSRNVMDLVERGKM